MVVMTDDVPVAGRNWTSEQQLAIERREGNLLGVQQSGARRVLRLLSVLDDEEVILAARDVATGLVSIDPTLASAPDLDRAARALESTEQATYMEMG